MTEKQITQFLYGLDTRRFIDKKYRNWVSSKLPNYFRWTLSLQSYSTGEDEDKGEKFKLNYTTDEYGSIINVDGFVYNDTSNIVYKEDKYSRYLPCSLDSTVTFEEKYKNIESKEWDPIHWDVSENKGTEAFLNSYFYISYALYDSRHFYPKFEQVSPDYELLTRVLFTTKFYLKDHCLNDILMPVVHGALLDFLHREQCGNKEDAYFYSVQYDFSNTVFTNPLSLENIKLGDLIYYNKMFMNCSFPVGFVFGEWVKKKVIYDKYGVFPSILYSYADSMFEGCTFPDNFCLNLPMGQVDLSTGKLLDYGLSFCYRMFANCTFGKNFRFKPGFLSFKDSAEEFFSGSIIPEDFCLKNQFLEGFHKDRYKFRFISDTFKGCVFLGSLKSKVMEVLNNPNIPEDTSFENNKTSEILRILINNKNDSTVVDSCYSELKDLVKSGRSLQQYICLLASHGNYSPEQVIKGYNKIYSSLVNSCFKIVPKYLIKSSGGKSVTVGQARDALISKGYPRNVVNEAIVQYLDGQVLV